jgi:hypothetical protein
MNFSDLNLEYYILASGCQKAKKAAAYKGQRPKEEENLPKIHS